MKKWMKAAALAAGWMILFSAAGASEYETYLKDGTVPSLKEHYAGRLDIGIAAETALTAEPPETGGITGQCNLLLCGEITRGKNLLDRSSSKKMKDPGHARVKTGKAADALNFAAENGMQVLAASVIQPDNTPEWFFNEDWADTGKAKKTDRDTMIQRAENAVRDQIILFNEKYPGLVSAWEIIRGDPGKEGDLFRETIGEDYPAIVFEAARAAAPADQQLLWAFEKLPDDSATAVLLELYERGLTDGVVLGCGMTMAETDIQALEHTIRSLSDSGLEIHLSGLEIDNKDRTAEGQIRLAIRYRQVFALTEKYNVKSVSFTALQDTENRDKKTPQRLLDKKGRPTPAFFGALQDCAIPDEENEEAVRAAAERLDLEAMIKKEAEPVVIYKKAEDHNPVMVQRFGADPWAMVYGDRVYLYMTGDEPVQESGEKPKTNDYSNITTLRVLSSADLVNWEDHGSVRAAGGNGAARWASNSWAPCAAWKNIDGKDRFFLYFANSGGGIGVLTSDSPTGPFTDPIGKPLISRATPTCASVTWLFDPAVLVDDDGSAYLYFGGGIPEGKQADPGTARVVKLNGDMISLDGEPLTIRPPWLFEDSGINRFGDSYVYSYCSNFNVPSTGSEQGFGSGEIVYMTSDSPTGPFTYAGKVLKNPSAFFGVGGNNHHCMFRFRDQWYITYHAATLDKAMGWNAGYRSTFVDRLELTENGLPAPSKGTYTGVPQLYALDPYNTVPAATAVSMAGATTEPADESARKTGTGRMAVVSTSPDGWIAVAGADFGSGASAVRIRARSDVKSRIEVIPDTPEGTPAVILDIPACEGDTEFLADLPASLAGVHDLYFRFSESGTSLLEWQFR